MKTLLVVLTLVAFALAAPLAMAQGQAPAAKPGEKPMVINCCKDGKCSQVKAEADCTKGGGKVVKDCKDCK
jgi:anti-sigma-K factor RskA